jgi:exodeoxyribonuclease III
MQLVSWNINSVRLRLPLLARLARETSPDIICLQEIKVEDALFPLEGARALGYEHIVFSGEKGYNGVAILSRFPLTHVHSVAWLDHASRRHIAATLPDGTELHNFYVPAGGDIPDRTVNPYYGFKLDFVTAMREWFGRERKAHHPMILVGDLNIAPLEHDVWSHKQLLNVVSHTPDEVERLNALQQELGWCDVARHFVPHAEKHYSWWSYRNRDWKKSNRGRRLDHIWVTQPLKSQLINYHTLPDARDWPQPSDHIPIVANIALAG